MPVDVERVTGFGWVARVESAWDGPIVVYEHPVIGVPFAIQCRSLCWEINYGTSYGARGVHVDGYVVSSLTHRPIVTPDGEPIRKILHLRRVLDVRPP